VVTNKDIFFENILLANTIKEYLNWDTPWTIVLTLVGWLPIIWKPKPWLFSFELKFTTFSAATIRSQSSVVKQEIFYIFTGKREFYDFPEKYRNYI